MLRSLVGSEMYIGDRSTALAGNDLATFPDFPAEIRAPQGTLFGVSASVPHTQLTLPTNREVYIAAVAVLF